jgi:MFS family permease
MFRIPKDTTDKSTRFNTKLYAPMILGSILNPINSSIIAVALVPIGRDLSATTAQTAWLVSALYLATAIGQPLVGRLVDTFGPRPLFLAGTALTGVAGIVGMFAPSLGVLIAARVILGFGTCAGYPASMSLIRSEANRTGQESPNTILTILAVATQTIAVIGPTLGGLLIGVAGWRATFAINVPLALVGLILGLIRFPRKERKSEESRPRANFDIIGILLFAGTLVALLLFLMEPGVDDLWLLAISAAAGTGFAFRELRTKAPFIDVRVFAGNLPLIATYGRSVLAATVSYAFLYGFTQWLEDGRGLSASGAGLILLPMFGIAILVSTLTGRRKEVRAKLLVGSVAQIVGCALLLLVDSNSPIVLLIGIAVIVGIPQGLNSLANQNALYHQAEPERMGSSAGLLRTFMYLGAILSSSASGIFFGKRADSAGLHDLAIFMVVTAILFFALTLFDRSLSRIGDRASIE